MNAIQVNKNSELLPAVWDIYRSVFPEHERFPEQDLLAFLEKTSEASMHAYVEHDNVVAMSYMIDSSDLPFAYLLFLGVSPNAQGGGIGTRVLNEIKETCKRPVVLDIEVVDDPTAENPEQRQRRLRFYERNGFAQTHLIFPFEEEPYEIMAYGTNVCQHDIDALGKKMDALFQ